MQVIAARALSPQIDDGEKTASLKWFALKSDGPGAESLGKDLSALMTSALEIFGGG